MVWRSVITLDENARNHKANLSYGNICSTFIMTMSYNQYKMNFYRKNIEQNVSTLLSFLKDLRLELSES